ncbi:hypothetical protein M514_03127 [Trichuris suis]|uniref:Rhodanese domain-containing protein n=1 Tax=Trichuris suis TaxID=68888 RepID=A0A085MFK7_9BILA|nr:hypothetical protein M513_03127 [Trichuris suis]KFD68240.1 hypothetical protein M514_03127 [Trichuris suis]
MVVANRYQSARLITGIGEAEESGRSNQAISNDSHPNSTLASFDQYRELIRYVLVDVRSQSLFTTYRLKGAVNFPLTNLCCGFNNEPPEMLALKNQPDKYIICYDDGETLSRRVAIFLSERDYSNVYVLSGGLRNAYELYPDGMVTGTVPQHWKGDIVADIKRNDSPLKHSCSVCVDVLKNCLLSESLLKPAFTDKELETIAKQLLENQKPKKDKASIRVHAKRSPELPQ